MEFTVVEWGVLIGLTVYLFMMLWRLVWTSGVERKFQLAGNLIEDLSRRLDTAEGEAARMRLQEGRLSREIDDLKREVRELRRPFDDLDYIA